MFQISVDRVNANAKNGIEKHAFKKDMPYTMDLTFTKYDFQKSGESIKCYIISKMNTIY